MCVCLSWYHSANQPESEEVARNCSTLPEVSLCISLYGDPINWAQLCNVRQTKTCVSLVKNPSSHVLSCACFSRTSFHLCLLQLNIPPWVCPSFSSVSTSGKHSFTCLPQQNSIQLTFQRTLKFPLHVTTQKIQNWKEIFQKQYPIIILNFMF